MTLVSALVRVYSGTPTRVTAVRKLHRSRLEVEQLEGRALMAVRPLTIAGSTMGAFFQPSAGVVSGVGTTRVDWGTATSSGPGRSNFNFTASSFNGPAGRIFSLGTLDYFNGTTVTGSDITSINLQVSVFAGAAPRTFNYPLRITSTTNTNDPVASADRVALDARDFKPLNLPLGGGRTAKLDVLGFGRVEGQGFVRNRSLNVQEGASARAELLAQVRVPGIYVAARDLNASGAPGTHQFLVLIPANPRKFKGLRDLGDGTRGFVIGAHNIGGRLKVKTFETADYQATREYFNPDRFTSRFTPDFDTELDVVNLSRSKFKSVDSAILAILNGIKYYRINENARPIKYPSLSGQFRKGCVNSNSWAQTVAQLTAGRRGAVQEDFSGIDTCHENRVPAAYFRKPVRPIRR